MIMELTCNYFHSNVLFREFALISMWRVPAMPVGAHTLLSLLAEPLKQLSDDLVSIESHEFSEKLKEFQDWVRFLKLLKKIWIRLWFACYILNFVEVIIVIFCFCPIRVSSIHVMQLIATG